MSQISSWYEPDEGDPYTLVGCSRRACRIYAKAYSFEGPWELPTEFAALLNDDLRDPIFIDPSIAPKSQKKSVKRHKPAVWKKAPGTCYYCGISITYSEMTIDHLVSVSEGGSDSIENLYPSCKSCNSSKGSKNLEQFRFHLERVRFEQENGVSFSQEQLRYLKTIGVDLSTEPYVFWFEKNST